jgi:S1-C subfamily serine protease
MVDQVLRDDTTHVPPARRGRRTALVVGVVVLVLLVAAAVVGGIQLHSQSNKITASRQRLATIEQKATASDKSTTASLKASQAQLAALEAQLTGTQNQLKADEKQLSLTQSQLPPDLTQLASSVSPSVVLITCGDELGSGFALSLPAASGYASVVVTAAHVVSDCVPPAAGATPTDPATAAATPATLAVTHQGVVVGSHLRAADIDNDVALIDVSSVIPALRPATGTPVVGEFTMAVGNPLGVTNNVTQGNVSKVESTDFLNTAPISSGNSGGPLVDRTGKVLGIADSGGAADDNAPVVENFNVALRLSTLCATLLDGSTCSALH